jgi:hypothetical protein
MTRFYTRVFLIAGGPLLGVLAAACSQVVATTPIDLGYGPEAECHSTLGAYFLPKALIHFTASKDDSSGEINGALSQLALTMVADRSQPPLCLDYLSLPTTQDIVTVQRDPSSGLLASISSDVTDETPQIVKSLVATGENLALAAARAAPLATGDSLDIEYDPFWPPEMELAKKAMQRFGFCIYIEGHSFPVAGMNAEQMLEAGRQWCSAPGLPHYEDPAVRFSALPVPIGASHSGILYRPNMTQKLVILRRKDPGAGRWQLFQTKRLDMPNVSPTLSIGVERAMFTERQTTLNFNQGVLTDVAVNKKSELVGFVSIPLVVAQAITSIPQEIVTLRISDTNNQAALINAQNSLVQAVATYQQSISANPLPAGAPQSALFRSGQLMGGCLDAHGPASACKTLTQQ